MAQGVVSCKPLEILGCYFGSNQALLRPAANPMVRVRRASLCICLSTFFLGLQLLSFTWAFCGAWHPHFRAASQCPVQCTGRRWRTLLRVKVGDELNGFQLDEPLGAGAFGTTWRARATNQSDLQALNLVEGQEVALKLIKLQDGWSTLDKFEREASVLQRLRHVSIPRYYGTVQREGREGLDLGLVSQLVEGKTLEEEVAKGRWVATPENLRVLAETLLEVCMHMASFAPPVVHRDIKPANILLEFDNSSQRTDPKIYLVDFGSAVLGSGTRTAAGTFGYMAPESFGNSFTPKSDLYGVGASLLFAATGLEPGSLPVDRLQVKFEKALVGTVWASRSWCALPTPFSFAVPSGALRDVSEQQGWELKRLVSFTKNRLVNRPNRPRDPELRKFMSSIGVFWPDQETDDEEEGEDSEEEEGGDEDSEEETETGSEEELEEHVEVSDPKGPGLVEGAGDSASPEKMPMKEERGLEGANEMPEPPTKKVSRKQKQQVAGGSVEERKGAVSSTVPLGDSPGDMPAEDSRPTKKVKVSRKQKKRVAGGSVEEGQGAVSSTVPLGDMPSEDSPPKKKPRTRKSAKPSAGTASKGKGKRGATETDPVEIPTPKAKSAKLKKSRTAGAAPPPPPPGSHDTPDEQAERRKKQSRKSSAYHKARYAAKKAGLSEEEQIAAGKEAS
eukprot:s15_g18.t1